MSFLDLFRERIPEPIALVEKTDRKESMAQNPMATAYASLSAQQGLRRPSQVTMQTLRRMSRANWVDRACIETLRDEITAVPWDIIPIDPKKPFDEGFQKFMMHFLNHPNRNKENFRTLIQKIVEDILVIDAGVVEKVRNGKGQVVELYQVDGTTIKPCFDEFGMSGNPAYQQFMMDKMGQVSQKPTAEWGNDDMIYIMWNPQGAVDTYGYGMSPVEAGLAVGTAFLYAEAYNLGFFRTNTIPPVVINMGKDVQAGEVDKFRSFLASEMVGQDGFHAPILGSFGDGFDIKELMKSPTEMGFKEYVEWQMRWKVALYRMAPQDIGFALDQYKAEGQVQQQLSNNKAIESLKGVLAQYINAEILDDEGYGAASENLKFEWIDPDVIDPLDQSNIDKTNVFTGVNTINEIRSRMGLDPVPGGEKPFIVAGNQVMPLDKVETAAQVNMTSQLKQADNKQLPDGNDNTAADTKPKPQATVKKSFVADEGEIVSLADNQTAIAWMDDRGVTQPLFVTDFGKTKGFTVKPSFLDDKKDQEPPEQKVAEMLRLLQVNTPDVKIMSIDDVVKLLPTTLYGDWTKYLSLEAPYDSQEWRQRWGNTRKSPYYIVTGFINAKDLGNEDLQKQMAASPMSYQDAVKDFARLWLAENKFLLGDRKPGHYLITQSGHGFGVDYQFYDDQNSWDKTRHWLPATLNVINPILAEQFTLAVREEAKDFGGVMKSLPRPVPADWTRESTLNDIEKNLASRFQKKISLWYKKAVHNTPNGKQSVLKADDFDPEGEYITNGEYVYQGGKKYPLSVLGGKPIPSKDDLVLSPSEYRDGFDYGANQVRLTITTQFPDIKLQNADLYAPTFEKRANYLSDIVDKTLRKTVDGLIVDGIDSGLTYGEIANNLQQALSVDPDNPDFPGWRAERIARTESMWAINEGMREQYQEAGIQKINIEPAGSACDLCIDAASRNPYDVGDENILPVHPNCRCVWVGEWGDMIKSFEIQKGWVTINGHHVFIGAGGESRGGGGGHGGSAVAGGSGTEMKVADVPGTSLKRTENIIGHEETDAALVSKYKQVIRAGHPVAPIVVARDGNRWGVIDGEHRLEAYKQLGEPFIPTINHEAMGPDIKRAYTRATEADQRAIGFVH